MVLALDNSPLARDLWAGIFPNPNPVWVEVGPGRGEFLIAVARQNRERNFFAIERSSSRAESIERRIERNAIDNARVLNADASCVLRLLPAASVAGYFVQFPDPWWKRRHGRRRLWTRGFVAALSRTLVGGATIEMVTDVEEYFSVAQSHLGAEPALECVVSGRAEYGATSFARKALARGDAIYRSVHRRRAPSD
jgi:tRNA (guanine-N7-)-methyltransferase